MAKAHEEHEKFLAEVASECAELHEYAATGVYVKRRKWGETSDPAQHTYSGSLCGMPAWEREKYEWYARQEL